MNESGKYIDRVRDLTTTRSDYAVAKLLDISEESVNGYRRGTHVINNFAALKIAEALRVPLEEVIAAAEIDREKDEKKKALWRRRLKTAASLAGLAFSGFLGLSGTTGDAIAYQLTDTSDSGITRSGSSEMMTKNKRITNYAHWPMVKAAKRLWHQMRSGARSLRSRAPNHAIA